MTDEPYAPEPVLHEALDGLAILLSDLSGAVEEVNAGPDFDEDELVAVLGAVDEIERDITSTLGGVFDRVRREIVATLERRGVPADRARTRHAETERQQRADLAGWLAMSPEQQAEQVARRRAEDPFAPPYGPYRRKG